MTPRGLHEAGAEVWDILAHADQVFCFLDYDGTLAPLAPTPDAAVPLLGTLALLQALLARPGVGVAIISGRPIVDVRRFLNLPAAYYVGVHGAELCVPDGAVRVTDGAKSVRPLLAEIRQRLEKEIGERPGIFIEDKGTALACHHRLANPADAVAASETVHVVAAEYACRGAPIRLHTGHAVCEIRPEAVDKGVAVYALLAVYAPEALPIYIGDDRTDEDAFAALPPHAITIRVGSSQEPTRARFRVDAPEAVRNFLRTVLAARVRHDGAPFRGRVP